MRRAGWFQCRRTRRRERQGQEQLFQLVLHGHAHACRRRGHDHRHDGHHHVNARDELRRAALRARVLLIDLIPQGGKASAEVSEGTHRGK